MKLGKRKLSGREKDDAAIELLEKLREQLYGSNMTVVRQTAFHLSWLQEDGLDILKEALYADTSKRTKSAASYGLRKMRGRMTKPALEVLKEGSESSNPATAEICRNALNVYHRRSKPKRSYASKRKRTRIEIRELPARGSKRPNRSGSPRRFVRHTGR
jgi:hypothetical protein